MTTTPTQAEALEELEQVRDQLNALLGQGAWVQQQIAVTYYSMTDRGLAQRAGYRTPWEYFGRYVKGLTFTTLKTYLDVAMYWGAAKTQKYGVERLKALDRYMRANPPPREWPDLDPGWMTIRVPQKDGSWQVKTFADCSLEEMQRAATPPKPRTSWEELPARDKLRATVLRELIPQYFEKMAPVRFSARARDGKVFVTVSDVPTAQLEELIAALQECITIKPLSPRIKEKAP
jgi:hypothetical protein